MNNHFSIDGAISKVENLKSKIMNIPISVILPCYNSEVTLLKTLTSINEQTFPAFEVIIINDGSTDTTPFIIKDFQFRNGIKKVIVDRCNKGFVDTLEEGISISNGDYIARIDADDQWLPDHLSKVYNVLLDSNAVLVGANAYKINENDEIIGDMKSPLSYSAIIKSLMNDNPIIHSSVLFSKDAYKHTHGYKLGNGDFYKHIADYNLWAELSFWGPCICIPDKTVKYRYLDNSMSRNINRVTNYRARAYVMKKVFCHFHRHKMFFLKSYLKVNLRILQELIKSSL